MWIYPVRPWREGFGISIFSNMSVRIFFYENLLQCVVFFNLTPMNGIKKRTNNFGSPSFYQKMDNVRPWQTDQAHHIMRHIYQEWIHLKWIVISVYHMSDVSLLFWSRMLPLWMEISMDEFQPSTGFLSFLLLAVEELRNLMDGPRSINNNVD